MGQPLPQPYNIACSACCDTMSFSPTNWICFNPKYYRKYGKWPDWCEFYQISRQWDQNSKIRWIELNVIMFWVNVLYGLFKMGLHVEVELNTCHEWNYPINHPCIDICARIVINRPEFWPENTFFWVCVLIPYRVQASRHSVKFWWFMVNSLISSLYEVKSDHKTENPHFWWKSSLPIKSNSQ